MTIEMNEEMVSEVEIQQILNEYHKKQLIENLTGPCVSFVLHFVLLLLMFIFIVSQPKKKQPEIMVNIVEVETIELEPEVKMEIEETETEKESEAETEMPETPSESIGTTDSIVDVSDDAPMTDDQMESEEYLDVVRTQSILTYSGPLGGRSASGRANGVKKYGGSKRGQANLNKALRWLAKVQNSNGSWGTDSPAHTGIALLVFLAHGETPLSEQYGDTVQRAMKWLADYGTDEKRMSVGINSQRAYGHGIATYAISESYAMTKIPFMQIAMEKCIDVIIKGQQNDGGFDYAYKKGERWDLSVSGWQYQALKAAFVAGATNEKLPEAIQKSIKFCKSVAYQNKRFGYSSPGQSNGNMDGVGVVCLQLMGYSKLPEVIKTVETINEVHYKWYADIAENPEKWTEISEAYLYGLYYSTQAIFNAQDGKNGKANWKQWREVFEKVLIRSQNPEGYWETKGHIGGADIPGRVLSTCFSALQLEVYYRYLPTFDMKKMDEHKVEINIENIGNQGLVIDVN